MLEGCRQTKKDALVDARKEVSKGIGVRCLHMLCGDLAELVHAGLLLLGWHNMQMCMQVMELIKSKHCNPILVRLAWHDSGTYDKVNCLLEGWLAACQPVDARRGYALYAHLVCTPVLGVHAPRAGASGLLQTGECGGSSMEAYWDTAPSRSMHLPCRTSLSGPSAVEPMGL